MKYSREDALLLMAGPPERLGDMVLTLGQSRMTYRHGPAFPTLQELVGHLAGAAAACEGAIRHACLEGAERIELSESLDPRVTADLTEETAELIQAYTRVRRRTIEFLRGLPADAWRRPMTDARLGDLTLLDVCSRVADHEVAHVSQARNLVALLPEEWVPPAPATL